MLAGLGRPVGRGLQQSNCSVACLVLTRIEQLQAATTRSIACATDAVTSLVINLSEPQAASDALISRLALRHSTAVVRSTSPSRSFSLHLLPGSGNRRGSSDAVDASFGGSRRPFGTSADGSSRPHSDHASSGTPGSGNHRPTGGGGNSATGGNIGGGGKSSVRPGEAEKFGALAAEWWDAKGPMAPLHAMNPLRARFVRDAICRCYQLDKQQAAPLSGLRILDVGCGGGLLSEALARMGAEVTGIDIAQQNIDIATTHAALDPLVAARTSYLATSAEQLVAQGASFDAVTALEVIEHVDDQPGFVRSLGSLTKHWGPVLVSTLSRTPRAFALAVFGAEYIARLLPRGTHDWSQFVTPKELVMMGDDAGLDLELIAGMAYDPLRGSWTMSSDTGVNYIAYFQRSGVLRGEDDAEHIIDPRSPATPGDTLHVNLHPAAGDGGNVAGSPVADRSVGAKRRDAAPTIVEVPIEPLQR